jgi:hypothetical protein
LGIQKRKVDHCFQLRCIRRSPLSCGAGSLVSRVLALLLVVFSSLGTQGADSAPLAIKPALWQAWTLVQLTDYVSRSPEVKPVNKDKFIIGVIDDVDVVEMLRVVLAQKKIDRIDGLRVEVVELASAGAGTNLLACNVVLVSKGGESGVFPVLRECARKGIIVVGHSPEFFRNGGVFRFDLENRNLIYSQENLAKAAFGLHRRFRRYLKSE